jgi:hypothetical protein
MEFLHLKLDRMILLKTCRGVERGEIVNLARNISKHGLLVPITVRRILHTDRYEVISGIKRFTLIRFGLTGFLWHRFSASGLKSALAIRIIPT